MRQCFVWLAIAAATLGGSATSALAETFSVSTYSVTPVGSDYDWSFTLTDTGGTFSAFDTVGVLAPGFLAASPGPSGWSQVGGPTWISNNGGASSAGPFTVLSNVGSGTAYIAIADADLPHGGVTLTVDPPPPGGGTVGAPEPGLSFFLTLGFGLFALALTRNRFMKAPRATP